MCRVPVPRAVHRFQGENLLLHLKGEHVLAVVLPVTGCLPQLAVVHVGGDHLLEPPLPVLFLEEREMKHKTWLQSQIKSLAQCIAVPPTPSAPRHQDATLLYKSHQGQQNMAEHYTPVLKSQHTGIRDRLGGSGSELEKLVHYKCDFNMEELICGNPFNPLRTCPFPFISQPPPVYIALGGFVFCGTSCIL